MANECNDCRTRRLAHEQDRAIEEQRRTALAALAEREDWARDQAAELDERVNRAGRSTLLATAYVPVDSIVNDEVMSAGFDVEEVRDYLFDGWTIVGTIPKTLGIGLTNVSIGASSGQTWGAGLGGNTVDEPGYWIATTLLLGSIGITVLVLSVRTLLRTSDDD